MLTMYSDGGSRGNPGNAAYGVVAVQSGRIVREASKFLGVCTNNCAEYRGLIAAMNIALDLGGAEVEFVMDSQLVFRQMTGQYAVRSPDMKALYEDAKVFASLIPKVSFRNVRRSEEFIPRADELVNIELDRRERAGRSRRGPVRTYVIGNGEVIVSFVRVTAVDIWGKEGFIRNSRLCYIKM